MKHLLPVHIKTGQIGEGAACRYLIDRGYRIIERNYRKPIGEIDIVAEKSGVVHFVEVKAAAVDVSRLTDLDFSPELHMNTEKKRRQKRVIETYLEESGIEENSDWQVDLYCVFLDKSGNLLKFELYEDLIL